MADDAPISQWRQILHQLAASELECVVVGGAALALHGLPRMTLDIDLHVPADQRALGELFALMLDSLHLQTEQASLRQILHRPELLSGQVITFRSADNADLVDVIVVPRSEFDDLFRAATLLEIPPAVIHVASIHDLRQMKAELGRPIDQADIVLIDQYLDILDHLRDPGTQLS